ncbi:hypothetical protein JMJ94_19145 [Rhodovulum visakhapatnamense]|uniref:Uncharacterized protein n=1 Tax=Rhodovulum visakhapatnamense TaxID=364297 RepID=A0ABS1RIT2_9RHOB|nr:hypothetical protein [Rhodovulum visakhapatnamense]MBL3579566.1 hypothetical protein [Rhodovulum visakhapatnamense]
MPYWFRFGVRQTEKPPRLVGDILEVDQAAALADDIEQISVFGRGGIGPLAYRALAGFGAGQANLPITGSSKRSTASSGLNV